MLLSLGRVPLTLPGLCSGRGGKGKPGKKSLSRPGRLCLGPPSPLPGGPAGIASACPSLAAQGAALALGAQAPFFPPAQAKEGGFPRGGGGRGRLQVVTGAWYQAWKGQGKVAARDRAGEVLPHPSRSLAGRKTQMTKGEMLQNEASAAVATLIIRPTEQQSRGKSSFPGLGRP